MDICRFLVKPWLNSHHYQVFDIKYERMNPRISLRVLLFFIAHGMDMGHFRRHTFRDPYCSFHGLTEVAWQAATKEFYVCLRRVDVQAEFNYKAQVLESPGPGEFCLLIPQQHPAAPR